MKNIEEIIESIKKDQNYNNLMEIQEEAKQLPTGSVSHQIERIKHLLQKSKLNQTLQDRLIKILRISPEDHAHIYGSAIAYTHGGAEYDIHHRSRKVRIDTLKKIAEEYTKNTKKIVDITNIVDREKERDRTENENMKKYITSISEKVLKMMGTIIQDITNKMKYISIIKETLCESDIFSRYSKNNDEVLHSFFYSIRDSILLENRVKEVAQTETTQMLYTKKELLLQIIKALKN